MLPSAGVIVLQPPDRPKKQHFNVRLKYKNKTQNSLTEEH